MLPRNPTTRIYHVFITRYMKSCFGILYNELNRHKVIIATSDYFGRGFNGNFYSNRLGHLNRHRDW